MNITERWESFTPYFKSLLRITAAIMFIMSGTMKLFAWPMGMPGGGTAQLLSQAGIGGMLETFGGFLLLIGLFTRPAAFILCGEMAVAYFQFHQPKGIFPIENGGGLAVMFCFLWLYFSAAGAGVWSLDNLRKKHSVHTEDSDASHSMKVSHA